MVKPLPGAHLGEGDLEGFSGLGFSFLVSAAGGAAAAGFFSLVFPAPRAPRPPEREVEEEEERDRELEPDFREIGIGCKNIDLLGNNNR